MTLPQKKDPGAKELKGRVALITGAGSGIGAACAALLATRGADVIVADLHTESAEHVASTIGGTALVATGDVSDPDACERIVEFVVRSHGRLDIAVNSAGVGIAIPAAMGDVPFSEWKRIIDINLTGTFNSMQSEIRAMRTGDGGTIVNIASVMAVVGTKHSAPYVASKHAVVGLTKSAALEYASKGIRVNAVGPGHIDSPMFHRRSEEDRATISRGYPAGRVGMPEEVAELVCFLASDRSAFATGGFFPLDGGYLAQ